jgi:hypothetical protein
MSIGLVNFLGLKRRYKNNELDPVSLNAFNSMLSQRDNDPDRVFRYLFVFNVSFSFVMSTLLCFCVHVAYILIGGNQ